MYHVFVRMLHCVVPFLNIVTMSVKFDPVTLNCLGIILYFILPPILKLNLWVGEGGNIGIGANYLVLIIRIWS